MKVSIVIKELVHTWDVTVSTGALSIVISNSLNTRRSSGRKWRSGGRIRPTYVSDWRVKVFIIITLCSNRRTKRVTAN